MKKGFKAISIFIAFILTAVLFAGCSFIRPSSIASVKNNTSGAKTSISFNEYLYLAYTLHASAESYAVQNKTTTKELLNQTAQGSDKTYNEYFKDEFKKTLANNYITLQKFNEFKYSLTEEEKASIATQYDQLVQQLGAGTVSKLRTELRVTEANFKKFIETQIKVNKVLTAMFEVGGAYEIKDEDAKKSFGEQYTRVKHILIKTSSQDAQGQSVPFDDAKLKEAEKKANDLLARANKGEKFEDLARYNSEDGAGPDKITDKSVKEDKIEVQQNQQTGAVDYLIENYGYIFGKGKMDPEFEKASFEMKDNEIRLVKSSFGYHIIKRYNINDKADYYDKLKDSIIGTMQGEKLKSIQEEWAKSYTITFDDKALNTYSLINLKDIASK